MSLREQWRKIERKRLALGEPAPYSSYKEESADLSVHEIASIGAFGASRELLDSIHERRRFTRRRDYIVVSPGDVCPRSVKLLSDKYINKLKKMLAPSVLTLSSGVDLEHTLLWFVARSHARISATARTAKERARIEQRRKSAEVWCWILSFLIELPRTSECSVEALTNAYTGDHITNSMVSKLCARAVAWLQQSPKFNRATPQEHADILWLMAQGWLKLADTAASLVEQAAPPTLTSEAVDARGGRPLHPRGALIEAPANGPHTRPEERLIAALDRGEQIVGDYSGRADYGRDEVPARPKFESASDEESED